MKSTTLPDNFLRRMDPKARKSLGKSGRTQQEIQEAQGLKLEKDIHNHISQWLNSKDIVFQHERMDGKTRGKKGWPDFTFSWIKPVNWEYHERLFSIGCEVKRTGCSPTREQVEIHERMRRNGWTVLVVHSLQELIEELKNL
jgi:hypothetical protein